MFKYNLKSFNNIALIWPLLLCGNKKNAPIISMRQSFNTFFLLKSILNCSNLYSFVPLRSLFQLINHLNLALTLWALTNILWIMLPAGPWPAPITKTSGSSSRERTNLDKKKKKKITKKVLSKKMAFAPLLYFAHNTYFSSSLSSPLSQIENLAFRERAWAMAVSMEISWLMKSYRNYI